ncbi:MAG: hypothetical protein U9Q72_00670 [Patescibacteria group bacterium]|nr:hypothetical protein [Patescibacteria group bacterium]
MEVTKLLKIIKKNLALIIILGIVSSVSALIFYKIRPTTYSVFFDINVSQVGVDQTADYQYDNYYSGKAVDTFTDSLEKWFKNPQLITEAYQKAGVDIRTFSSRNRSKLIKARKTGPQYLEVSFNAFNQEQGEKIVASLTTVLREKVINLKEDKEVWFKINVGKPLIVEEKWKLLPLIIVSFTMGVIVGGFLSLFKYYLKSVRKQ